MRAQGSKPKAQRGHWAALVLVATVACGNAPKAPPPSPAPAAAGLRVTLPSGAVYKLELARTPEEQQQGLMFRESLSPNAGMLFLFGEPGVHQFWMKNTMIPLDMIWLDAGGKVLFVSADTPPCRADPCPNYGPNGPAVSVLEIAGGMAAREKIVVGSVLKFVDMPK